MAQRIDKLLTELHHNEIEACLLRHKIQCHCKHPNASTVESSGSPFRVCTCCGYAEAPPYLKLLDSPVLVLGEEEARRHVRGVIMVPPICA